MKNYVYYSDTSKEMVLEGQGGANISELEAPIPADDNDAVPSPGKELQSQPVAKQLEIHVSCSSTKTEIRSFVHWRYVFCFFLVVIL